MTNDHKPGGLTKQRILSQFWKPGVQNQGGAGQASSGGLRVGPARLIQLLGLPVVLG